jgi:hypothetical protein
MQISGRCYRNTVEIDVVLSKQRMEETVYYYYYPYYYYYYHHPYYSVPSFRPSSIYRE